MITLCVYTDGRDHIYETIPTALDHLHGPISRKIIYDDSGDAENRARLAASFPEFVIAHHPDGRQGFGGAIRFMWRHLTAWDQNSYVLHLEDDFTFRRDIDLAAMLGVLDRRPDLAQIVLRRQAWNAEERAAGGIVELHPEDFTEHADGPHQFLTHRRFWSTNPCLYRRALCERGWPEDPHSEGKFGATLRDDGLSFAFWGARDSGEWVEHVGRERVGTGY